MRYVALLLHFSCAGRCLSSGTLNAKPMSVLRFGRRQCQSQQNAFASPTYFDRKPFRIRVSRSNLSRLTSHGVLLTGSRAYKIKKPVDLGFADFSSVERRRRFCEEEIRLNSRTAPDVYLGVVPITLSDGTLHIDGDGETVDYAVCMRQFDSASVLSGLPLSTITNEQIDLLADDLARFHAGFASAPAGSDYGLPDCVWQPVYRNFDVLRQSGFVDAETLNELQNLAALRFEHLRTAFNERKNTGHIRECHGDLHLGNMFLENGRITVFDGIEFNDSLRWIDVASDLAFLVMDLEDHDQHRLASRLLNRWLERTGTTRPWL